MAVDKQFLGVCTWIFGEQPVVSIARQAAELGFDGLALSGDSVKLGAGALQKMLKDYNLRALAFTPASVDLAHPSRAIREQARQYYRALIEFAASVQAPLVGCHNVVGRVSALASHSDEWNWFAEGIAGLARAAERANVTLVLECLNRYESHLCNSAAQGLDLITQINSPALGLLLDTYHMNIEEANLPDAIRLAGRHLALFHIADSNRQAVGNGHIDFRAIRQALRAIDFRGPIIVEVTAPGSDPFTPINDGESNGTVWEFAAKSLPQWRELDV